MGEGIRLEGKDNLQREDDMDTTTLDRQMGDLVWCFYSALRAGYNLPQVFEQLSQEVPEPARGACKSFYADLCQSVPESNGLVNWNEVWRSPQSISLDKVLEHWKHAYPSAHIIKVSEKIQEWQKSGGHLADLIEPLEVEFVAQSGSDPAFYPAMRQEAVQIGARLPERAKENQE
jgi:hypothetical protein